MQGIWWSADTCNLVVDAQLFRPVCELFCFDVYSAVGCLVFPAKTGQLPEPKLLHVPAYEGSNGFNGIPLALLINWSNFITPA